MIYTVSTDAAKVLEKLAAAPRVRDLGLQFSGGWNETTDKKAGYFDTGWAHPDSWNDVILQGPHLGVSTPMIKQPNPTLKHNQDWSEVDLEAMPADFIPATAYQPDHKAKPTYSADYTRWEVGGNVVSARDFYRVAWRQMAATTGFRTVYPAILPPGAAHVHGVSSAGGVGHERLLDFALAASSIVGDFFIRSTGIAFLTLSLIHI